MTPVPVRTATGPLHLCKPTGRGYTAACGVRMAGDRLVVHPRRLWARAWRLERVCTRCEAKRARARTEADLARVAGW